VPVSDGLSGGIVGINRNQLGQGNCHGPPLPADHHEHVGGARIFRCHALIYTAAPDSEGTLGGLVTLGEMANLEQHLDQALECLEICSSDPLCAETTPEHAFMSLHGAACHNCLFLPETSCERGNRYLDRSVLAPTMERAEYAFFRQ
jgi:hypothetical protein